MQLPSSEPDLNLPISPTSLKELAEILIKHFDHHEGFYEVGFQFNIAVGSVGTDPSTIAPGAIFTVGGVGLTKCLESNPLGVNASVINPLVTGPSKKIARKKTVK